MAKFPMAKGVTFTCPHPDCNTVINSIEIKKHLYSAGVIDKILCYFICHACNKMIIYLLEEKRTPARTELVSKERIYPNLSPRPCASDLVPQKFSEDYNDACKIVEICPRASAALSRRCLQHLIHEHLNITDRNLSKEIDKVIETCGLPSHLNEAIDAIRNIGNFAAHPMKSEKTTEIVNVEDGEAEWCLDVLEGLFDFCFVQPVRLEEKRKKLNEKLRDAGRPELKTGRLQAGDKPIDSE